MQIKNLTHDDLNGAGIEMKAGETVEVDDEERGHQLIIRNPQKFAEVRNGVAAPYVPEPDLEPGKSPHRHVYKGSGRKCTVVACGHVKSTRAPRKAD